MTGSPEPEYKFDHCLGVVERGMLSGEGKSGFSAIGIAVSLVVATSTFVIGFFLNRYLSAKTAPKRTVTVSSEEAWNLILPDEEQLGIRSSFTLLSDPSAVIKSYFLYHLKVSNDGEEALEQGELFVHSPPGVTLIKTPLTRTEPPGLADAMHLSRDSQFSGPDLEVWRIGLLNPGEEVLFVYGGYALSGIQNSQLKVVFRKKDWSTSYSQSGLLRDFERLRARVTSLNKFLNVGVALTCLLVVLDVGRLLRLFKPSPK